MINIITKAMNDAVKTKEENDNAHIVNDNVIEFVNECMRFNNCYNHIEFGEKDSILCNMVLDCMEGDFEGLESRFKTLKRNSNSPYTIETHYLNSKKIYSALKQSIYPKPAVGNKNNLGRS